MNERTGVSRFRISVQDRPSVHTAGSRGDLAVVMTGFGVEVGVVGVGR